MGRQKLSERRRITLRKEILKRLSTGESQTSLCRALASKYRVSTVTLRWYLRTLQKKATKLRSINPHPDPKSPKRPSIKLLDIIAHVSEKGLTQAIAAKKLYLELQRKLTESDQLRRAELHARRTRQIVTARARAIERKLRALTLHM